MKKYLMTGIAALAMGGLFTSCGPSMDSYGGNIEDYVKQSYEQKFIERFGEPAPNQTWGFGSSTVAGARGMTRTLPEKPSFRDTNPVKKPTMPNYSNTVPSDAQYAKTYQNYKNGDKIYIDNDFNSLNNPQNFSDLVIYADGTNVSYGGDTNQNGNGTVFVVTQNSTLTLTKVQNNLTVYLAPGATLKLPNDVTFQKSHAAIYLNEGSKVEADKNLTLVESATILNEGGTIKAENLTLNSSTLWNGGTVDVTKQLATNNNAAYIINETGKSITAGSLLMNNNNDLLYNGGTVDIDGNIKLNNTAAEIINNNSLECTSLEMYAGAKFHNVGTVNMTGKTYVENTNSRWMNDGQYTCGEFELTGGINPTFVFNNCKLTVNGNFHQNHGAFSLDANGSVICESFTWDSDGYFYMGSKSLLKVAGDLLARNQNSGGYGFRGEGDDYAVIQAGSIKKESEGQYRAAYYGKLYIDTDNHFAQGGTESQPWYYYENTVKFSKDGDASPVTIPATACNPGFGNSGGGGSANTDTIRVIAEDLTVNDAKSDFDFNDVVFDVIWNKTQNVVSVELLAAGGELTIYVGGDENGVGDIRSVNEYFILGNPDRKDDITDKTMINTVFDPNNPSKDYKHEFKTYKYDLKKGWSGNSIEEIANSIYVRVIKSNKLVTLTAEKGRTASKIAVGTDYDWCDERQDIDTKYNGKFSQYVQGQLGDTWYK